MLSMNSLFANIIVNFLVVGVVWLYVLCSYRNFGASRYWCCAAFAAVAGAALALIRTYVAPWVPILFGSGFFMAAAWLGCMGIQCLYGHVPSWRIAIVGTGLTMAGLAVFTLLLDNMPMRILIFSLGQTVPFGLVLKDLFGRSNGRGRPGGRLTGCIMLSFVGLRVVRTAAALLGWGGSVSLSDFNEVQAAMLLLLAFLAMAWNFSLMLMAIDRLRSEVADLAMLDDLTGVANRRCVLQRLSQECLVAQRTGEPFALLAIDLDGFKAINDSHGHGAGDECLRMFTRAVQSRLRPSDLLARSGGDEFCAVLPSTTLREGAMIARYILEECRQHTTSWQGAEIRLAASIGVAQWTHDIGVNPERLVAAADRALYAAKNEGKDRYAVHHPAPIPAPEPERIQLLLSA